MVDLDASLVFVSNIICNQLYWILHQQIIRQIAKLASKKPNPNQFKQIITQKTSSEPDQLPNMINMNIPNPDPNVDDRVYYLFQCSQCGKNVRNKSFNQHKKECGLETREFQKQITVMYQSAKDRTKLYPILTSYYVEKIQKNKEERMLACQQIRLRIAGLKEMPEQFQSPDPAVCPLCLDSIQGQSQPIQSLCLNGHFLHHNCIIQSAKYRMETCPICRQEIRERLEDYLLSCQQQIKQKSQEK